MVARKCGFTIFRKGLSTYINSERIQPKSLHPFKCVATKTSVLDYLSQNIIYKDDKIVVLNKPPDVAKTKISNPRGTACIIPRVFMEDLMPDVQKLFPDLNDLTIVKFPERYTSGVMIAASKMYLPHLEKCKRRAKGGTELCDTYLTITQGHPVMNRGIFKLAVKLTANDSTSRKVPILVDNWSSGDMKNQRIAVFRVEHSVRSSGADSSLVELSISSTGANSIRLFLATKLLSPLLGDDIFASRVKHVLKVPLLIDPWSDVANSPKKLSSDILHQLQLNSNESKLVVPMVHLRQVRLPGYFKNEDLLLEAPPPPIFNWTCQQLGLSVDQKLIKEKRAA